MPLPGDDGPVRAVSVTQIEEAPAPPARQPGDTAVEMQAPCYGRRCPRSGHFGADQHLVGSVPAARAINAVKLYGNAETSVRALDGVDVDFAPGCFTAIMGPSGSGKSTLLHCLAGLDTLTAGVGGHRQHHPGHAPGASAHPPAPGPHRIAEPVRTP